MKSICLEGVFTVLCAVVSLVLIGVGIATIYNLQQPLLLVSPTPS